MPSYLDRLRALVRREPTSTSDAPTEIKSGGWTSSWASPGLLNAFGAFSNHTGVAVTPHSALQQSAVLACVKVLSEDVAKIPVRIRRAQHNTGKINWVNESRHPLNRLFRVPNSWQTAQDFWRFVVVSQQLWGNSYIAVRRDNAGSPRELIPLLPSRTAMLFNENGSIYYQTTHPMLGAELVTLSADDVLHVRNFSLDGFLGLSAIQTSQEVIGLGLAAQKHASKIFSQGTILTGVLSHPGSLSPEAAIRMADGWNNAYAGSDNAHKVALLEEGVSFSQIGMTAQDSQLLETRNASAQEIARCFRVPLHKINLMDNATFSNIEQQEQSYINDVLMCICKCIEEACERDLLFDDERGDFQIRFDFDELLRGDTLTRYQSYQLALNNGFLNVNEVRARENLPPVEGGDMYRIPLNTGDLKMPLDAGGNNPTRPEGNTDSEAEPTATETP